MHGRLLRRLRFIRGHDQPEVRSGKAKAFGYGESIFDGFRACGKPAAIHRRGGEIGICRCGIPLFQTGERGFCGDGPQHPVNGKIFGQVKKTVGRGHQWQPQPPGGAPQRVCGRHRPARHGRGNVHAGFVAGAKQFRVTGQHHEPFGQTGKGGC